MPEPSAYAGDAGGADPFRRVDFGQLSRAHRTTGMLALGVPILDASKRGAIALGALEMAVLDRLWTRGAADVADMHAEVGVPRGLASNTIQSTLERLHRKGLAERSKRGRAYEYRARISRQEWLTHALSGLLDATPGADADLVLSAFVDLVERTGEASLDALEERAPVPARARREGMSAWLATLALGLVTLLAFALATSLAVALAWPALRAWLRRADPRSRARRALGLALAPTLLPLLLLALCLAPGVASWLGLHEDHCLHHAGHAHLCFAHPSLALHAPLAALLCVAALLGIAALAGWRAGSATSRACVSPAARRSPRA